MNELPKETYNSERIVSLTTQIGQQIYLWILEKCYYINRIAPISKHLLQNGWSNTQLHKIFYPDQIKRLEANCAEEYDISLLHLLWHKLPILSPEQDKWRNNKQLDNELKTLKNLRNNASHISWGVSLVRLDEVFTTFQETFQNITTILQNDLNINSEEVLIFHENIMDKITHMWTAPRSKSDLIKSMENDFASLIREGIEELHDKYKQLCKISPFYFLDGFEIELEVESVFTEVNMVSAGRNDIIVDDEKIRIDRILQDNQVNIILIEGNSGAGKSTLIKYLLQKWVNKEMNVRNLSDFDLVLYFECRSHSCSSLKDLVSFLFSKTLKKYAQVDPMVCLSDLKTLILVDGFDEINSKSMEVIKDIFEFTDRNNILAVFTSRPSDIQKFYKMKPIACKVRQFRLDGIADLFQESFVERLFRNLTNTKIGCEDLIKFIRSSPQSVKPHFAFPINLTLITFLWCFRQDVPSQTKTVTGLYLELTSLLKEKLCERIIKKCAHFLPNDIICAVNMCYDKICEFSFHDYINKKFFLSEESLQEFEHFCSVQLLNKMNVIMPAKEILEAFLSVKHVWTSYTSESHYSYLHKSIQEHMSAQYICKRLLTDNNIDEIASHGKTHYHFFSLIDHILGILASLGNNYLKLHAQYVITKFSKLNHFRVNNLERWFPVMAEVANDELVVKTIAKKVNIHGSWKVWSNVSMATEILKYRAPYSVWLRLKYNPFKNENDINLTKFLEKLSKKKSSLEIELYHSYLLPKESNNDDLLRIILSSKSKLNVTTFRGHIIDGSLLRMFSNSLNRVFLAVTTSSVLSSLLALDNLKNLNDLVIHIDVNLSLEVSNPFTFFRHKPIAIMITGVTDANKDEAINKLLIFQQPMGYNHIDITGSSNAEETEESGLTGLGAMNLVSRILCFLNEIPLDCVDDLHVCEHSCSQKMLLQKTFTNHTHNRSGSIKGKSSSFSNKIKRTDSKKCPLLLNMYGLINIWSCLLSSKDIVHVQNKLLDPPFCIKLYSGNYHKNFNYLE